MIDEPGTQRQSGAENETLFSLWWVCLPPVLRETMNPSDARIAFLAGMLAGIRWSNDKIKESK